MPEPVVPAFVVAFVVGVTPGKWAKVWGERLPRHPLALRPMGQAEALAALESGAADVALLRLPVPEEMSAIPLYTETAVVVAPRDHPLEAFEAVAMSDLAGETLLGGGNGQPGDTLLTANGDTDWAASVELVAANVGVAVMPQSVARALSRRDVIARPLTDGPDTRIALAWVTAHTTPQVEQFIGIVRGRTANSSRGGV